VLTTSANTSFTLNHHQKKFFFSVCDMGQRKLLSVLMEMSAASYKTCLFFICLCCVVMLFSENVANPEIGLNFQGLLNQ